jgi:hypothetical protein
MRRRTLRRRYGRSSGTTYKWTIYITGPKGNREGGSRTVHLELPLRRGDNSAAALAASRQLGVPESRIMALPASRSEGGPP